MVEQPQVGVVQSFTCPTRGTVTADTITNSVSITDIPSALDELEEYARSLDLRQPQVNIKAKIILVDRTTLEGLGLRYDLGTQQQFFNDIVPRLDSTGKPLHRRRPDPARRQHGLGHRQRHGARSERRAAARLLDGDGQLRLHDLPRGAADEHAPRRSGRAECERVEQPHGEPDGGHAGADPRHRRGCRPATAGNFPRATVQMQQTGVILTVTPQITSNRQIQMRVHVENSDVQFQANDVGAVFPKQSVDNEVLVADGETAVMGGLTQTTCQRQQVGHSVLVDLPIIGRLFGVTNRQETKRDLLILITPHIIDDGQSPPPDSSRP